jgi:rRNA maturation protein Nop10
MNRAADALEELQKTVLRLEDGSGILDELPMVDQREPPKAEEAEWTKDNTCSRCGDEACAGYDEEPWLTRYCPHCGAKMKNPEEYE